MGSSRLVAETVVLGGNLCSKYRQVFAEIKSEFLYFFEKDRILP